MTQTVVRVGHSYDGPNWSVASLTDNPTRIPNIVVQAVKDNTLVDLLLRKGPQNNGAIAYEEKVIFSSLREDEIVAEYGEIPRTQSQATIPTVRGTQKRALGLQVSRETRTRDDRAKLAEDIALTRDQLVRGWNKVFFAAVNNNPNVLKMLASNADGNAGTADGWLTGGIRRDIADATLLMANQQLVQGAVDNDRYGFRPDTMVIHPTMGAEFIDNEEVNKVFQNSPATTISPRYTMRHPQKFGQYLDIIESWEMNPDEVMLCARNKMGFVSDEWPMFGEAMDYIKSRQVYETFFSRRAAVGIDNPKSVLIIKGVTGVATTV